MIRAAIVAVVIGIYIRRNDQPVEDARPVRRHGAAMNGRLSVISFQQSTAFAAPVPVPGDAPVPVDRLRLGNPTVLPMTGTWRFKLEHGKSPAVKGELPADAAVPDFAAPDASDADWKNILVPANWEIEGFSIPTYQERTRNQSTDIGLYRRRVDVPASFANQRAVWHFDGAYNGAEVFVNGQRCGYHESGFTAFDIDVTKALKPGQRNLMAVTLMKACNTNAVRLSHYNHAERFMELCDEVGFYVLDEIPSCWVANEIRDASRTWAYVFRSKETLVRDKNRACVVIWSCGNESSYGVNNQAEFDYMKANDPTRLALISQQNLDKNPKSDFEDYHIYPSPSPQRLRAMATSPNRAKVPVILTEYGAGGPRGLADTWGVIWSTDAIVGAFLWEWQAQGMYDKFPERWNIPSPGARNDPKTGYRSSGGNGPVTADRKIRPIFYTLKSAHSPANTTASTVTPAAGQCVVPLQNRYSFTDLSELTCRWQALAGEKVLAHGESHIAAKPRSSVDASLPAPPGMDTLRLEFIHRDGRSVYVTSLHVKG